MAATGLRSNIPDEILKPRLDVRRFTPVGTFPYKTVIADGKTAQCLSSVRGSNGSCSGRFPWLVWCSQRPEKEAVFEPSIRRRGRRGGGSPNLVEDSPCAAGAGIGRKVRVRPRRPIRRRRCLLSLKRPGFPATPHWDSPGALSGVVSRKWLSAASVVRQRAAWAPRQPARCRSVPGCYRRRAPGGTRPFFQFETAFPLDLSLTS